MTICSARLGYMPQDKRTLLKDLTLSDSWRAAIEKFPAGMIVYTHLVRGRLTYLSGRSIEGKQHYNVPREILGERQPYYNSLYSSQAEQVVIVEGQADAITFAEWGIPAVAIGGMSASDELLKAVRRHKRLFVALDNTASANTKSRDMAVRLGGETYLPQLPHAVKDANEWLAKYGANITDAADLLNQAQPFTDEQIITLNGQEVALKVIPEGSEFLMRWRHSDIKRFLEGETVALSEVFNAIHRLFSTYVDFRSEGRVDFRIFSQRFPMQPPGMIKSAKGSLSVNARKRCCKPSNS